MKKLIPYVCLALCFVFFSAVEKEHIASDNTMEMMVPITESGTYVGYVNTVGTCGFSFRVCATGNILLLNKSGYSWRVGDYYTINVGGLAQNCGYSVTWRGAAGACVPAEEY